MQLTGRHRVINSWCTVKAQIFGPLYFANNRAWFHAIAETVIVYMLGSVTLGLAGVLSWIIYGWCAHRILASSLRKNGWIELT